MTASEHKILKLWVRPEAGARPEERPSLELKPEGGVVGDHAFGGKRHLTLVFEDDWGAAAREIGRPVDPVGRRANVLLTGGDGIRYLGAKLRLGDVIVEIGGITDPCDRMNEAAEGMRKALEPNARAGIWGRIVAGGEIRLGEPLRLET